MLEHVEDAIAAADSAIGIDGKEWEPHMIKADAFGALSQVGKAQHERNEAKATLGSPGRKSDELVPEDAS